MRICYLFDVEGWALHNVGLALQEASEARGWGIEFTFTAFDSFVASPRRFDKILLSYSEMLRLGFDFRNWCDEVLCIVQDPCELSNFQDCVDWPTRPMRHLTWGGADRIGAASQQLADVLRARYSLEVYRTPTFPHDAGEILAHEEVSGNSDGPVVAVSSARGAHRLPIKDILWRLRAPTRFLYDERGHLSAKQLTAAFSYRSRKNFELLNRISELPDLAGLVCCQFATGEAVSRSRAEYLRVLRRADVYICTSFMEGGPLPVMEAVLCGAAVLSTPVGQVSEWVVHGESGFICPDLDAFRDALHRYAGDRSLLESHKQVARRIAREKTFAYSEWRGFLGV